MKEKANEPINMTPKGCAVVAAVDAGMIPEVEGGYNLKQFEAFWKEFNRLLKHGEYLICKRAD